MLVVSNVTFLLRICFLSVLQLHINPTRAIVQLRPSMEHLTSGGSKKKNNVASNVEATIKSEDLKDEKSAGSSKKQVYALSDISCY